MGSNNDPKLLKATALAKATTLESRVNQVVATTTGGLSPVVVYLEGADALVSVNGGTSAAGSWECPAGIVSVQVEAWGAGGGGGGGTSAHGGSGGGGGEYASEQSYQVIPGNVYTYAVGRAGQGGVCGGQGGWAGGTTVFDTTGPGVIANGGAGGDGSTQLNGGSGSSNSVHFNGGNGGVSSSGLNSDNPAIVSHMLMWWLMDEKNGGNGRLSQLADSVNHGYYGTVVNGTTANVAAHLNAAPSQVPTSTTSTTTKGNAAFFKQVNGQVPAYVSAKTFGLGAGVPSPYDGSALTVSCWVKGDPVLGAWSTGTFFGKSYATLASNCDYARGINESPLAQDADGFALVLQNNVPVFYLNNSSVSAQSICTGTALSPTDNLWHQVAGTWDGATMRLYQDGAQVSTATPSFSQFAQGKLPVTTGANPDGYNTGSFNGYMSNLWLSASAVGSSYISTAYGSTPGAGGSGGGASGGSARTGNSGGNAVGGTGGAGGAGAAGADSNHGGSGAGGSGSNTGVSGNNAPSVFPFGGGGGGSGEGSGLTGVGVISVQALTSASYMGVDSAHVPPGGLYATSVNVQTGTPNPYPAQSLVTSNMYVGGDPGSSYNGSMNSVAVLPNLVPALTGLAVNAITLTMTIQSTNASVLPVSYGTAKDIPVDLGSDTDISQYLGTVTPLVKVPVPAGPAGRTVTFDITDSVFAMALRTTTPNSVVLVFGGFQGSAVHGLSNGAWNDDDVFAWNTVLTGAGTGTSADLTLNIETWPNSGGNTLGGDGAPGGLVLSYVDPHYWPTASVQPSPVTDADGNQHAAGFTTDSVVGYDPTITTSPRQPATWNSLGTLTSGSGLTVDTARYRYAPDDGGTLAIQLAAHTSATVLNVGGYTFSVVLPAQLVPSVSSNSAYDQVNIPLSLGAGSLQLPFGVLRITGRNNGGGGHVSIQIPGNLKVVSGYPVHVNIKISLL